MVSGGYKEMFDEIFIFYSHSCLSFTAPVLAVIKGNWISFYITAVGYGDNHILFNNHVLYCNLLCRFQYFSAARISEFILYFGKLLFDDLLYYFFACKYFFESCDIL